MLEFLYQDDPQQKGLVSYCTYVRKQSNDKWTQNNLYFVTTKRLAKCIGENMKHFDLQTKFLSTRKSISSTISQR